MQGYLIGKNFSGFNIISYQNHLTRPWEIKYRNLKNSHFLETGTLLQNIEYQNKNLYKKIRKLFPEYLI